MGLDAVELLLEVEETFGFSIPDEDAAALDTAGKLYDYIMDHRFRGRREGCLTSVAFYKLRRALMLDLGVPRSGVRPPAPLATIITTRRRRVWVNLRKTLGLRLPELARPRWVTRSAIAVAACLVIPAAVFLVADLGISGGVLRTLGTICLVSYVLYQGTRPLAVEFRPEFATIAGLTKAVLKKNYAAISDECDRANVDEVWETLRAIIVEQLGVPLSDVTREASFAKDLGIA